MTSFGDHHGSDAHFHVDDSTHPTEALTKLLLNAQADHRKCVSAALKAGDDVVDKCALTWGEVDIRYRAWAAYRPPFPTEESEGKYRKHWTPARVKKHDSSAF